MHLLSLITISLFLSFVPFSVSLSTSVYRCVVWKEALRIAIVFAVFHAVMMLLGWAIGFGIKGLLFSMAVPMAVVIIFIIGARLLLDSRRFGMEQRTMAVENNKILYGFAFVTSINTALLGMGLGLIYKDIFIFAGFIFVLVFIMAILGVQLGKKGMMNLGRTIEMIGGIGLLIVSLVIVLQYLKII